MLIVGYQGEVGIPVAGGLRDGSEGVGGGKKGGEKGEREGRGRRGKR